MSTSEVEEEFKFERKLSVEEIKKKLNLTYEVGSIEYYKDIIYRTIEIAYIVHDYYKTTEFPTPEAREKFETEMHGHFRNLEALIMWADEHIQRLEAYHKRKAAEAAAKAAAEAAVASGKVGA